MVSSTVHTRPARRSTRGGVANSAGLREPPVAGVEAIGRDVLKLRRSKVRDHVALDVQPIRDERLRTDSALDREEPIPQVLGEGLPTDGLGNRRRVHKTRQRREEIRLHHDRLAARATSAVGREDSAVPRRSCAP
jgi:hypothetical protein